MISDRILYVDNYYMGRRVLDLLVVDCAIRENEHETLFYYCYGRGHIFSVTKPPYEKDGKIYICGREGYHELFPCTLEYLKEHKDLISSKDVLNTILERCHTTDDLWEFARRNSYFRTE